MGFMKKFDVVSICNALMDILVMAREEDLETLQLTKGVMHLVDKHRQNEVLSHFQTTPKTTELGGSSLNAVRSLAALGANTAFAGMIGQDDFGRQISARMEELGIHAKLETCDNDATGSCAILVTPDGERTMNTNLGASRLYSPSLVPHEEIKAARIFHFSGYQWDTEGQISAIQEALHHAKTHNTQVSFDIADPFVVNRHRDQFKDLIVRHADIVFANKEEARLLYGSPEAAADEISRAGAIAVIKLGAKGALIAKGSERIPVDAIPTNVVDTTAAGDMFAAGFLYGHYRRRSLGECGHTAALLASDVISRVGASLSDHVLDKAASL